MPQRTPTQRNAKLRLERRTEALARWIQEHMPWPYSDVERDSTEAEETALHMAQELIGPIHSAFEDVAASAEKGTGR